MEKFLYIIVFSFVTSLVFLSPAFAQPTVVVPNNRENTDANGSDPFPFNCEDSGLSEMRYQQVYLGSEIGQAGMIDKISFRINDPRQAFESTTFPDVRVYLSTTDAEPLQPPVTNPLSSTFDDNIGDDVTNVFMGDLVLSALNCVERPCPFDVMIPLQRPFLYDPENGNLLFEIRIPDCVELDPIEFEPSFDLATNPFNDDKVSRAWDDDVDSDTASQRAGVGLVTEFRFAKPLQTTPIPTLSEWGLIAMAGILGIVGFMVIRRKKVSA